LESVAVVAGASLVHLVAVASPGPNFVVISRTALVHSRRAGVIATAGVATGTIVYVVFGFLGVTAILERSVAAFRVAKYVGAAYLIYLGLKSLWAARHAQPQANLVPERGGAETMTDMQAYRTGLFTMATNAKAALYFLAFFTTIVSASTAIAAKVGIVLILPAISFTWYSMISTIFSRVTARRVYARFSRMINATFGGLLVALGVTVALSRR
jgi:RhtB (resistance to homoserine/threonine) family protein